MSRDIPVALIDPDPDQPRKHFDPVALSEFAATMVEHGLAAPILVRPAGDRYRIVHGERRWRAAAINDWDAIPAIVRDLEPEEARRLSLVENVQRSDLTPIEEAQAYRRIVDGGETQETLGRWLGKSQSYVAQKLRLLTLPEPIQVLMAHGALSEGHARQLLTIKTYYGPEATRSFEWVPDAETCDFLEPRHVFFLFRDIRPEDGPPLWIGLTTTPASPVITEACAAFDAWVDQHRGRVPSWTITAFWFAGLTEQFGVSVHDLTHLIRDWKDRQISALRWVICREDGVLAEAPASGPSTSANMEAWGWWSDLRHAGAFDNIQDILRRHLDEIRDSLNDPRGIMLPSAFQPWGLHRDRYADVRNREDAGVSA